MVGSLGIKFYGYENGKPISQMDYLYYRLYKFGVKLGDLNPREYAIFALSVSEMCLLWGLIQTVRVFRGMESLYTWTYGLISVGILLGFNYWKYDKYSFEELDKKWRNENPQSKTINGILVLLVVLFSYLLFFGIAGYIGEMKKNG